jgi:lia operon protein LiaF
MLIGIGIFLLLRPKITGSDIDVQIPVLGDQQKTGTWTVQDHEIWWFVGSNRFNFTDAVFPEENTKININGFVVDIKVILPKHVGLEINANSFVSELKAPDQKEEKFLSSIIYRSPNYDQAESRVTIQTSAFVSEINVKHSLMG